MQQATNTSTELIISYIRALDAQDYDRAAGYLSDRVQIMGPSGETFRTPSEYIGMLSQYRGKYDLKKVFNDVDDVCLIYEFNAASAKAIMCSWYKVKEGKISWIQTIFDPSPFAPTTK